MVQRRQTRQWICGLALLLAGSEVFAAELAGVVQWARRVELGTPQSGIIVEVPVQAGDAVKKGARLVQLENRALLANVRRAEAEQALARKARGEGKRELERANELYERTLLSDHDLEQAKIAFANVNSRYQAASAALVEARLDLEQSTIVAPFDGVILQRNAEVGQTVVSALQSTPLVTMAETRRMQVHALANQPQLEKLTIKQKLDVVIAGKHYPGEIVMIGLEPLPGSGEPRYQVRVEFANEGGPLRVGQSATVMLP